jgi:hypothetical protein
VINPDHLLELAAGEVRSQDVGAPRQAVLRRAVSTAYYGLFHALLAATAIAFVPAEHWKVRVLFYRALEHARTRERCRRLGRDPLQPEEVAFFGFESFPVALRLVANEFARLQDLRHQCDYDPSFKITKAEAMEAVDAARITVDNLRGAGTVNLEPRLFLSYLLFGLRG